jgi:hypothetical protein
MFSHEDQEAILRFIFSREANVELALGVLAARQSISERIIKDFLTRLEVDLSLQARQLGDTWTVVNELKTNPFEHWLQVCLTKQEWNDLYRISLEPVNMNARVFVLGVWNNWATLGQRLDGGRIRAALQGHLRSGTTNDWWPFSMSADPYQNWVDERTLSCFLGKRGVQAVADLTGAMLTIARATEKVIDTVVHEWREQQTRA